MSFDRKVFTHQYVLAQDFVRHAAYARAIKKRLHGRKPTSNFWPQTYNAHVEAAIHDWCKIFGVDGSNATHWRHTPKVDVKEMQEDLRKRIYKKAGLDSKTWYKYWDSMCTFRNKYSAHVEIDANPYLPLLDTGVKVAYAYDGWIRNLIKPDFIDEDSLERLHTAWLSDGLKIVMSADGIGEMV